MIIAVRHGATEDNGGGKERLRGWRPIPLSIEGIKGVEDTADSLSDVEDLSGIFTSDLVRAVQTAHEIAKFHGIEIEPMEELRDWNTADLAGEKVSPELIDKLHDYVDHPLKKVPGGESYQFFLDRIIPVLKKLVESDKLYIVVVHGRIMTLLKALAKNKGKHPDTATLKQSPPVDPGGLAIVSNEWDIPFMTKKDVKSGRIS